MNDLVTDLGADWELNHDSYEKLSKAEFDQRFRKGEFENSPLVARPSKWMNELGPYNPECPAFGILKDGRRVWCDTMESAKS